LAKRRKVDNERSPASTMRVATAAQSSGDEIGTKAEMMEENSRIWSPRGIEVGMSLKADFAGEATSLG
jgi:hypothetical protein